MRMLNYPEDIEAEYSVPEGAPRTPSASLLFSPPASAEVTGGRVRASATLSNPTAKPIPVVFWLGTLRLELKEDAAIRIKPRDPRMPPLPAPVPPPPFRIVIPARSTVKFGDEVFLDEYDYQGSPEAKLEWSLQYADGPKPSGSLSVRLPARAATSLQDRQLLLARWKSLPDLYELAARKPGKEDVYVARERLESRYRAEKKPFRRTDLFRHMDECSTREHRFAASEIVVVNAVGGSVATTGLAMHEAEVHGAELPAAVAEFLRKVEGNQ